LETERVWSQECHEVTPLTSKSCTVVNRCRHHTILAVATTRAVYEPCASLRDGIAVPAAKPDPMSTHLA